MIKKRYVIISLLAFCLTATLFIATKTSGKKEDNLWTIISELQTKVDGLNASNIDLMDRVEMLENQMLPQGFVSAPAYDSGWVSMSHGNNYFEHGLGTTEVLVYLIGNETGHWGINQIVYGGMERSTSGTVWHEGAHWDSLTEDSVRIYRQLSDPYWDQVRVMIWKISEP